MRMRKEIYEIIYSLPDNATYEQIEEIAKKYNLNPIFLFLAYNDYLIRKLRSDVIRELMEDEWYDYDIEDWL